MLALASSPGFPHAISWSCNSHVSVVGAQCIYILDELDVTASMGTISCPKMTNFDVGELTNAVTQAELFPNILSERVQDQHPTRFRAAEWAPLGCQANQYAVLATLTNDHRVSLYIAPTTKLGSSEWREAVCISDLLFQYLVDHCFSVTPIPTPKNASQLEEQISPFTFADGRSHTDFIGWQLISQAPSKPRSSKKPAYEGPPRPRGRPRIYPKPEPSATPTPPRPRGRPRKTPKPESGTSTTESAAQTANAIKNASTAVDQTQSNEAQSAVSDTSSKPHAPHTGQANPATQHALSTTTAPPPLVAGTTAEPPAASTMSTRSSATPHSIHTREAAPLSTPPSISGQSIVQTRALRPRTRPWDLDRANRVSPLEYIRRKALIATTALAWSPLLHLPRNPASEASALSTTPNAVWLALGGKGPLVTVWRVPLPFVGGDDVIFECAFDVTTLAPCDWVSSLDWSKRPTATPIDNVDTLKLAVGSVDGSVRLCRVDMSTDGTVAMSPYRMVCPPDMIPITAVRWSPGGDTLLAATKGTGVVVFSEADDRVVHVPDAHVAMATGVTWSADSQRLVTCSADGCAKAFRVSPLEPIGSVLAEADAEWKPPLLGIAFSPCAQFLTIVRQTKVVRDQMYQARRATCQTLFVHTEGVIEGISLENALQRLVGTVILHDEHVWIPPPYFDIVYALRNAPRQSEALIAMLENSYAEQSAAAGENAVTSLAIVYPLQLAHGIVHGCGSVDPQGLFATRIEQWRNTILQNYVWHVLRSAGKYCNFGTDRAKTISDEEKQSVLLMCNWVQTNSSSQPKLVELAQYTAAQLGGSQGATAAISLNAQSCPICSAEVRYASITEGLCASGHRLPRCALTWLIIDTPGVFRCKLCHAQCVRLDRTDRFAWLKRSAAYSGFVCPWCAALLAGAV